MAEHQQFDDFLRAVAALRDNDEVRTTAHTSNAATEQWLADETATAEAERATRP